MFFIIRWILIYRSYRATPHRPMMALLLPPHLLAALGGAAAATALSEVGIRYVT